MIKTFKPSAEPYQKDPRPAAARAEASGFEVIWGNSRRITVDLDNGKELNDDVLGILSQLTEFTIKRWTSKSGHGEHVCIDTKEFFTVTERAAIQAALGSDPKREMLALLNTRAVGYTEPFMLFKPIVKLEKDLDEFDVPDGACPF